MPRLRPAAVSGSFYPSSAIELRDAVRRYLDQADDAAVSTGGVRALIAPHAGYLYSGPIAGSSFRQLGDEAGSIATVVLIGPSHHYFFEGLALPDADAFETPLGRLRVSPAHADRICDLPQVKVDDLAHDREHSLEVELPFLQETLGEFDLVPLVVGSASPESVAEVLERLWTGPETLVVISSDLSHYLPYDQATRVDRQTADRIVDHVPDLSTDRACGAIPINGLLLAAERRGLTGRLLDLRNSGDTAGDRSRVVGYGAFAFGAAR